MVIIKNINRIVKNIKSHRIKECYHKKNIIFKILNFACISVIAPKG